MIELAHLHTMENLHFLIGGDSKILIGLHEKKKQITVTDGLSYLTSLLMLFTLESWFLPVDNLLWANNRQTQTFEKLNRILVSTDIDLKFNPTMYRPYQRNI